MACLANPREETPGNPLDLLEELVLANDWHFDRTSDSELAIQVRGRWADYNLWTMWNEELRSLYFACHFDSRVPDAKKARVHELLALFNETLWMGHFDITREDGGILFRHTVPLRGTRGASVEQLEDLVDSAVSECERFYPALQLVVWGGAESADAMAVALMDTAGEA